MDEKQIKTALENIATKEVTDDMNLWPLIQKQIEGQRYGLPRRRPGWILVIAALLIMASATVYAVDRLLQSSDPGLDAMSQEITYLDITQPVPGTAGETYNLRVTLDYAYADANRITVSYTVTGEAKASEQLTLYHTPALTDDRGNQFVWLPIGGGGGGGGGSDPDEIITTTTTMTTSFDASLLTDTPEMLNLNLKIDVAYSTSAAMPVEGASMIYAGPTMFEFSIPFNAGRVMNTPQTVTAGGIEMTLQKVVVAPSLTRVELCYADPEPEEVIWSPHGHLVIEGEEMLPVDDFAIAGLAGQPLQEDDACRALIIPQALQDHTGEWTLTIDSLRYVPSDQAEVIRRLQEDYDIPVTPLPEGGFTYGADVREDKDIGAALQAIHADLAQHINGPWVFTFTLP